jgi:hypothetical protein
MTRPIRLFVINSRLAAAWWSPKYKLAPVPEGYTCKCKNEWEQEWEQEWGQEWEWGWE